MHGEMTFPPQADSVRLARTFVSRQLSDAGLEVAAFTAALLVSELVTNAVLHARTDCIVVVDTAPDAARVSVADESPRPVLRRRHSVESGTGRGLMLVDRMAASWGVEERVIGKAVWFEVRDDESAEADAPDLDVFLSDDDLAQESSL